MDTISFEFKIHENEFWWVGVVDLSSIMPFDIKSDASYDLRTMPTCNQVNPIFISSSGRWAWMEEMGTFTFKAGVLKLTSTGNIEHGEEGTIRKAYLHVAKKFFPADGKIPDPISLTSPQYCTWMQFLYEQNQENTLAYARFLKENGMPSGELVIDDGWEEYYGHWDFNLRKFPEPEKMCKELKELGFKVVLWIVPYLSADSDVYRYLKAKDCLLKDKDGKVFIADWWNGLSAMLDFTNPEAVKWFEDQCEYLEKRYGIDGFKMDGGDARFAPQYLSGKNPALPHDHSRLYAEVCEKYSLKELRACVKNAGKGIIQRIADKRHSWERLNGMGGLIEKMTLQGLSGYAFTCPDMVGGGLIDDTYEGISYSEELYIRYMQLSALMPMFQFSKLFWQGSERMTRVVKNMVKLHSEIAPYIIECAEQASKTCEPIIRSIAYQFNDGFTINDQFMLGDKYLVAPVVVDKARSRKVYLPEGKWKFATTGEIFDGKQEIEVKAELEELPYFINVKE